MSTITEHGLNDAFTCILFTERFGDFLTAVIIPEYELC